MRPFFARAIDTAWTMIRSRKFFANEVYVQAEQSTQPGIREVGRLIEKVKVGMLVTRTRGGHLVSRPLRTRAVDSSGTIWFFTLMSSDKVADLLADGLPTVMFCRSGMRSAAAWAMAERLKGVDAEDLREAAAIAGYDLGRVPL